MACNVIPPNEVSIFWGISECEGPELTNSTVPFKERVLFVKERTRDSIYVIRYMDGSRKLT